MLKRYNIDTENDDLVQIDLQGDSWVVNENEKVLFTIISFSKGEKVTISIGMKDLEKIRSTINNVLPK